jgi:hypothetical protein
MITSALLNANTIRNDNFVDRTAITGQSVTITDTNVGATKESCEPNHAGNRGGKSVWWTWTAPSSGSVQIDTMGSNFDTTLGVYRGSAVSALTTIASNDDGGGNRTSKVAFNAVGGTVYQIAVDGYNGASGNIMLHVNLVRSPENDNYANRSSISGTSATITATNVAATKESREPNHAGNRGGKSVWWSWTAPSSGSVQIDTMGSNFDTTLGIYRGSAVSALTTIASNDDGGGNRTSKVAFNAVGGTVYQIAVDGYNGASGNISLHVNLTSVVADTDDQVSEAHGLGMITQSRTTSDTISNGTDVDLFAFSVSAGQRIAFDIDRSATAGLADSYIRLFNARGRNWPAVMTLRPLVRRAARIRTWSTPSPRAAHTTSV